MIRTTLVVVVLAATGAALAATAGAKSAESSKLEGTVGPGYKIEVEKADKDVKTLKPGPYKIEIKDKSSIHNFHLIGPGINKKTSVSFMGEKDWTIRLKPGRYTYQCDPHAALGMKGHFTVKK
jgi:plastocyanin